MSDEPTQPLSPLSRRALLGAAGSAAAALASGTEAAPGSQVVLATVSANYREGLEVLARQYEKRHPGVTVKIQVLPVNGYETWLRTQIPGGGANAPDIFNANYGWGMYERGLTINFAKPLDQTNPYTGKPWRATLNAQFLEKFKVGGDNTFIPLDFIEIGIYYNQDVFDRLGLRAPTTWEEMLAAARRIREAGITPFAVPGNTDSYWSGTVGWMARFFTDAYLRHLVPIVASRPGDWDYDARKNAHWRLDLTDPYNDSLVVASVERQLIAIRDGVIRMDSDRMAEAYTKIREFSRFWQRGFHGANNQTAYHLFLTQRAAMLMETSSAVGQILRDMGDLPARARFRWSIFAVPRMTQSRFHIPPFRGVGGAGTVWTVVKKDRRQVDRAVDFLMFITTPEAAGTLIDLAVRNRRPLVGPMLIRGAKGLPENLRPIFKVFDGHGFEKLTFRGLIDEQQSSWEWAVWAQRYMDGRLTLKEFLDRYQRLMVAAIPRVIATNKLDMNPRTRDKKD